MALAGLRVLHVTNMYPSEERPWAGAFVAEQVRSLESLGLKQEVYEIPPGAAAARYLQAIGKLRRYWSSKDFHVVHAHYGTVGLVATFQRLPTVVTFAGSDLNGVRVGAMRHRLRGRVEIAMSQFAAWRADRIIVMSNRMKSLLWFRDRKRQSMVLPYGIDTKHFAPGDKVAARRYFGLPQDAFVVLWPHSASPIKRRDLAEAAIESAQRLVPSVRLWKPPPLPWEMMPRCYHAADCLLVTSQTEGSPNVVKEALSTGLPVISVDVGDVWEWIKRTSWCAPVTRDAEQIGLALARVAPAGRPPDPPDFIAEFDLRAIAERLIQVYEGLLRERQQLPRARG